MALESVTEALTAVMDSVLNAHQSNSVTQAEVSALRSFCHAMAQTWPGDKSQLHECFAILAARNRPDESLNQEAAERFDVLCGSLSAALRYGPDPIPPQKPQQAS